MLSKKCMLAREGRVVNESSVYGHAKVESD